MQQMLANMRCWIQRVIFVAFGVMFFSSHIVADTQSEVRGFYQQAFQQNAFAFIGGHLHSVNLLNTMETKNIDKQSGQSRAFKIALAKIASLENLFEFDCLTETFKSCIVVYGSRGPLKRIAHINSGGAHAIINELPFSVEPNARYLVKKPNNGWLVLDHVHEKVYQIEGDGTYSHIETLTFDPELYNLEIHQNHDETGQYATVVLVKKGTLFGTNRHEVQWVLLYLDRPNRNIKPPTDCLFKGIVENVAVCSFFDGEGNTIVRQYKANEDGLLQIAEYNWGADTISSFSFAYEDGLFLGATVDGRRTVRFLPLMKQESRVSKILNQEFDSLQANGNLSILSYERASGRLLLLRQSPVEPHQIIVAEIGDWYRNQSQDQKRQVPVKILEKGFAFFDNEAVKVTRRISKKRMVPYTVVHNPDTSGQAMGKAIVEVYGSFSQPLQESYLKEYGKYWVNEGGIYVFVHVRGSGGFGRMWQQAGYGIKKIDAVLDIESVAEEIISDGFAERGQISLFASSAGGIIAGSAAIRRPDIFANIALTAPCLVLWDNARDYCTESNEFGNPLDAEEMKQMRRYSPGHLLMEAKEVIPFLIVQSSHDPIVPPAVTKSFLDVRPDLDFARVIQIPSDAHGELWDSNIRADVAIKRLFFFLGHEDEKGARK